LFDFNDFFQARYGQEGIGRFVTRIEQFGQTRVQTDSGSSQINAEEVLPFHYGMNMAKEIYLRHVFLMLSFIWGYNTSMDNKDVIYCPRCGTKTLEEHRFGRMRPVCPQCGWIHFADPKVAAGVLVEKDGRVLLARRINEPFRGLWTLPAGFVNAGEDPAAAAATGAASASGRCTSTSTCRTSRRLHSG
jgi:ribosomal protein S27AE